MSGYIFERVIGKRDKDGTWIKPSIDQHIDFIETWRWSEDEDPISILIVWNKLFSEIPIDQKFPFKGRNYHITLSKEEAVKLRNALNEMIGD